MKHASRVWFYAVTYASMLMLREGSKFDECGPKPGVVTSAKAASMGASLLAKCGRNLFLKYSIHTEALSKGFSYTCVMLQLCSAYHDSMRKKRKEFVGAMAHCFVKGFQFIVTASPLVFSKVSYQKAQEMLNMFSGSLEEIMNSTTICIKGDFLGSDTKISLAMVRYVRSVIFMSGKG